MVEVQGSNWRAQLSPSLVLMPPHGSRRRTLSLILVGVLLCLMTAWQFGRAAAAESAAAAALNRAQDIQQRTDVMARTLTEMEAQLRVLNTERSQMAETLQKKDAAFAAAKDRVTQLKQELKQELHQARYRRVRGARSR